MADLKSLIALRRRRLELDRSCTDPAAWLELAEAYKRIGALTNAASCRARAAYYAAETEILEEEIVNA